VLRLGCAFMICANAQYFRSEVSLTDPVVFISPLFYFILVIQNTNKILIHGIQEHYFPNFLKWEVIVATIKQKSMLIDSVHVWAKVRISMVKFWLKRRIFNSTCTMPCWSQQSSIHYCLNTLIKMSRIICPVKLSVLAPCEFNFMSVYTNFKLKFNNYIGRCTVSTKT
jgi:hypothetical protein